MSTSQHQHALELDPTARIAVDDAIPEDDSTYGSTVSSMTASLNSDSINYPVINGRRYHAYQSGVAQYAFPNDESEMERLDIMHGMIYKALGNRLYLAPLEEDKIRRALDLGTGTGIWAIDFSDQFPNAEVMGIDLSPIQPGWVPPNVTFHVDDMEQQWTYKRKFDYVFARYLACALKDYKAVIKQAFQCVIANRCHCITSLTLRYFQEHESRRMGGIPGSRLHNDQRRRHPETRLCTREVVHYERNRSKEAGSGV